MPNSTLREGTGMTAIAFIGTGNMGAPMVRNLLKAGHDVTVFDRVPDLARGTGGKVAASIAEAVAAAEVVVTMLPAGKHVKEVYGSAKGVFAHAPKGALLIDSSTIDVDGARKIHQEATDRGFAMLDAPVSGGVAGAEAASLTFMVGGSDEAFARARPLLASMGQTIVHAGRAGNGQAAKICNNMILGVSMIAVSEAFTLGEKLGLDPRTLFEVSSKSSGQCWSLTSYCPVPGLVPAAPSNRDYAPGFSAEMMLKDLKLAQMAARNTRAETPLGAEATAIYAEFAERGHGADDFSAIIRMMKNYASKQIG